MTIKGPYRHANGPTRAFVKLLVFMPSVTKTGRHKRRQAHIATMIEGEAAVEICKAVKPGDKLNLDGHLYNYVPIRSRVKNDDNKDFLVVKVDRWEFIRDTRHCEQ